MGNKNTFGDRILSGPKAQELRNRQFGNYKSRGDTTQSSYSSGLNS